MWKGWSAKRKNLFLRTLDKGIKIFNEYIEKQRFIAGNGSLAMARQETASPVSFAFKLNDTYGFPVDHDLPSWLGRSDGPADEQGFEKELQNSRKTGPGQPAKQDSGGDWICGALDQGKVIFFRIPPNSRAETEIAR